MLSDQRIECIKKAYELKGEARGEAKGIATRNAEIAKSMLANGIDISLIATCTNLSIEQISSL